jgi:AraC family transcriptional regulator
MSLTNKALFVIERNLASNLSLDGIAAACNVSRFTLSHAFGEATGKSVMDYVRGRRLSKAAESLAEGADDILSLALETGYASHEAFTRAFRAQFGKTPEEVRAGQSVAMVKLVSQLSNIKSGPVTLAAPSFERAGPLLFVGLAAAYFYGTSEQIAPQWQRFMRDFYPDIPNRADGPPVGVSARDTEGDNFTYICAAEVSAFGTIPKGLTKMTLARSLYAVFPHDSHVTQLNQTYAAIWDEWIPSSGKQPAEAPSLQRHNATFDPRTGNGGVTVWIPIEG